MRASVRAVPPASLGSRAGRSRTLPAPRAAPLRLCCCSSPARILGRAAGAPTQARRGLQPNAAAAAAAAAQECFASIYEPLFLNYGVDVVLNGHVHAYERTHPMYQYQVRRPRVTVTCKGDPYVRPSCL